MITGNVATAPRIGILAEDGERASHAIVPRLRRVRLQLRVDAPPHDFRDGHAQPLGAPFHLTMLRRVKLYLYSHHDGMIIPSWAELHGRSSPQD